MKNVQLNHFNKTIVMLSTADISSIAKRQPPSLLKQFNLLPNKKITSQSKTKLASKLKRIELYFDNSFKRFLLRLDFLHSYIN